MPTDAEKEAAARAWLTEEAAQMGEGWEQDAPTEDELACAEAALIAAEEARTAELLEAKRLTDELIPEARTPADKVATGITPDRGFAGKKEARSEGCPDCGRLTRYFHAGPMGPSVGDKGEFLKVPYECECKAGDEARTQPCEGCDDREEWCGQKPCPNFHGKSECQPEWTQPEWGDREETLRRRRKAADKRQPETGQPYGPDSGQPNTEPPDYAAIRADERRRIVALIEGIRRDVEGTAQSIRQTIAYDPANDEQVSVRASTLYVALHRLERILTAIQGGDAEILDTARAYRGAKE